MNEITAIVSAFLLGMITGWCLCEGHVRKLANRIAYKRFMRYLEDLDKVAEQRMSKIKEEFAKKGIDITIVDDVAIKKLQDEQSEN